MTFTQAELELMEKEAAEEIRKEIIEMQKLAGRINNKIDAFAREYDNNETKAKIYIWASSVDDTSKKVKSTAKDALVSDGTPKSISAGLYNIDVTFTTPGLSLDTTKFKKLDEGSYLYLAGMYPKSTKPRATVKVTQKKGTK